MTNPETPERPKFIDASPEEQIERFKQVKSYAVGAYKDFWQNVYKYPERFTIPGKSPEEVAESLGRAATAAKSLESLLEVFKSDKVVAQGNARTAIRDTAVDGFLAQSQIQATLKGLVINPDKARSLYDWTVQVYQQGGAKIGRESEVSDADAELLQEDLGAIVHRVVELSNEYTARRQAEEHIGSSN